jgi:hypothetical protein
VFIFAFLPGALLAFHSCRHCGAARGALLVLPLLSLLFYGWWNPAYLPLLVPLILANWALAVGITRFLATTWRSMAPPRVRCTPVCICATPMQVNR